jgi:hypothetical protein
VEPDFYSFSLLLLEIQSIVLARTRTKMEWASLPASIPYNTNKHIDLLFPHYILSLPYPFVIEKMGGKSINFNYFSN